MACTRGVLKGGPRLRTPYLGKQSSIASYLDTVKHSLLGPLVFKSTPEH